MTAHPLRYFLRTEHVGALIDRHHLSHEAFAVELGVSRQHWSTLYNGRRPVSPKLRRALLASPRLAGVAEAELFEVVAA
ncbi:MAG: helix-turn-helix domain-containing protein [Deltaproteobacteria bacterium]|nr:helix-turn-helix domain-containing protein [Deltaproteobacteria bacterium]